MAEAAQLLAPLGMWRWLTEPGRDTGSAQHLNSYGELPLRLFPIIAPTLRDFVKKRQNLQQNLLWTGKAALQGYLDPPQLAAPLSVKGAEGSGDLKHFQNFKGLDSSATSSFSEDIKAQQG